MLTIEELRALPEEPPEGRERPSGVYFLWKGDDLMYVGASVDVSERRYWHHCAWRYRLSGNYQVRVDHDRFNYLLAPKDRMRAMERAYIAHYRPPFNKQSKPASV